ncbi:MAG: hypothetical protein E6R13_00730 [Spirochaetes bacterium]|nr:MAG: hypothetical protein E6R13_00730 [Spirochaetota bacterium]
MNKEKIVKDSIELVKRFDNMSNSDCEDEGVVSSEFGTIGVGVFAALRDCYFNGYSSNKDVSNKEMFTDEEISLLQEIVKQCINKAIDYDNEMFPDAEDTEPVVSIVALEKAISEYIDIAYKLGEDVQE